MVAIAIGVAGIAGAGAALVGSSKQSSAATSAASTQAAAANQGTQLQQQIFQQTQQNLSPFIQQGSNALDVLRSGEGLGPISSLSPTAATGGTNGSTNPAIAAFIQNNPQLAAQLGITGATGGQPTSGQTGYTAQVNATGGGPSASSGSPLDSPLLGTYGNVRTFAPTEGELSATPGYQWNLSQGLKSIQSAAAARGLGVSGAALKGAATYGTGLADSTFGTQANNFYTGQSAQTQNFYTGQQNKLNALLSQAQLGENAAAGQGSVGATTGANIAGTTVGAGQALAAGQVGSANAIAGGLSNAASGLSSIPSALLTNQLLTGGGAGSGGMYSSPTGVGSDSLARLLSGSA